MKNNRSRLIKKINGHRNIASMIAHELEISVKQQPPLTKMISGLDQTREDQTKNKN